MERRQQYLIIGLIATVVLWQGNRMVDSNFWEPMRERQKKLADLEKKIQEQDRDLVQVQRKKKNLDKWKQRSLPPDPVKNSKTRPTAINAQRLYHDWHLGDLQV